MTKKWEIFRHIYHSLVKIFSSFHRQVLFLMTNIVEKLTKFCRKFNKKF